MGAVRRAHDPHGMEEAKSILPPGILYCDGLYETMVGADAIVLLTEWNAYRGLDFERVKRLMRGRVFVDLRNVYEPHRMREAGLRYDGVGRL
jgi:UDPglucose 6-dehydrogenase